MKKESDDPGKRYGEGAIRAAKKKAAAKAKKAKAGAEKKAKAVAAGVAAAGEAEGGAGNEGAGVEEGEVEEEEEVTAAEEEVTAAMVPREDLASFFRLAEERLRSAEARGALRALALHSTAEATATGTAGAGGTATRSTADAEVEAVVLLGTRPAVQPALVCMQRSCFGAIGVNVDDGCAALSRVEVRCTSC